MDALEEQTKQALNDGSLQKLIFDADIDRIVAALGQGRTLPLCFHTLTQR